VERCLSRWGGNRLQRPALSSLLLLPCLGIVLRLFLMAGVFPDLRRGHRETAKVLEYNDERGSIAARDTYHRGHLLDDRCRDQDEASPSTKPTRPLRDALVDLRAIPSLHEELYILTTGSRARKTGTDQPPRTGQGFMKGSGSYDRGELRWVSVHGFPVRDGEGRIWAYGRTARTLRPQRSRRRTGRQPPGAGKESAGGI